MISAPGANTQGENHNGGSRFLFSRVYGRKGCPASMTKVLGAKWRVLFRLVISQISPTDSTMNTL